MITFILITVAFFGGYFLKHFQLANRQELNLELESVAHRLDEKLEQFRKEKAAR